MSSPKVNEKPSRSHSASRRSNKILSPTSSKEQIADEDLCAAQHVERVKNEQRMANSTTKQDEDRRRRTIIVEKKNGSYGFTLQSYGIHYKKEQEIEMITYVDYVEYDGPAYKAGMREGDVILSINGQDMEKADHKALVNFIKNCDSRMRMVVLFEDCVRKVELHIRYIQLQRILQSKTAELDMLCLKEREVLQGKWKSHSLPARKKASSGPQVDPNSSCQDEPYCRPTVSIEDVTRVPSQPQILLAYQCSKYPCVVQSENSNECLVKWTGGGGESTPVLLKANGDSKQNHYSGKGYQQPNRAIQTDVIKSRSHGRKTKHLQHHTKHLCNPCMQAINNQDNASLEAYDLASPCCDPHCVPSTRRKLKQQKNRHGQQGKCQEHDTCKENVKYTGSQKATKGRGDCGEEVLKSNSHKSHKYLSSLVSQFSLHSCTSSDASHGAGENSGISYTTSLSSDTLYWDGNENKVPAKQHSYCRSSSCKSQSTCDNYHTFQPVKPKSWDNLTTKAFGGYGFGYGYIDTGMSSKNHPYSTTSSYLSNASSNTMPCKVKSQAKTNQAVINLNQINFKSKTGGRVHTIQIYHNGHRDHDQPAKSTENLLLLKRSNPKLPNSSLSCECLEIGSPIGDNTTRQYLTTQSGQPQYCYRDGTGNQSSTKQRRSSVKHTGDVSRL